jgi:hypothetical protein
MSTNWKARLAKLAKTRDEGSQDARNQHAWLMQQISNVLVSMCPDLRLVEPCDTDPDTYADIRETIDVADGRIISQSSGIGSSPELVRAPLDPAAEQRMREMAAEFSRDSIERSRRREQAVDVARLRLGRLPLKEPTAIPPEPASS